MREILFRGQKICHPWNSDYLEWQYGDLMTNEDDYPQIYSHDGTCANVFMETVGQYTGITDNHGKKIFEGDIVRTENDYRLYKVEYVAEGWCAYVFIDAVSDCCLYLDEISSDSIEVVGNIYDNPEITERSEDDGQID